MERGLHQAAHKPLAIARVEVPLSRPWLDKEVLLGCRVAIKAVPLLCVVLDADGGRPPAGVQGLAVHAGLAGFDELFPRELAAVSHLRPRVELARKAGPLRLGSHRTFGSADPHEHSAGLGRGVLVRAARDALDDVQPAGLEAPHEQLPISILIPLENKHPVAVTELRLADGTELRLLLWQRLRLRLRLRLRSGRRSERVRCCCERGLLRSAGADDDMAISHGAVARSCEVIVRIVRDAQVRWEGRGSAIRRAALNLKRHGQRHLPEAPRPLASGAPSARLSGGFDGPLPLVHPSG